MTGRSSTSFRIASINDITRVQSFIDEHWRRGHVVARDEALLRWQHLAPNGTLNVVLAERNDDLVGMLGFLDPGIIDHTLESESLALAMWVTRADIPTTGVGIGLVRHLLRVRHPALVATVGVAIPAQAILHTLGFSTGHMSHHAILNPSLSDFTLARVASDRRPTSPTTRPNTSIDVRPCVALDDGLGDLLANHSALHLPGKTLAYIRSRFGNHPRYTYQAITVSVSGRPRLLLVCRIIEARGRTILRCVDSVGDVATHGAAGLVAQLLSDEGHEYLDVVHHAEPALPFPEDEWVDVRSESGVELPGFFEPFSPESRTLRFAFALRGDEPRGARLFLADTDQDRPNNLASDGANA